MRDSGGREGGLGGEIDAVGTVLLEVQDELGRQVIWDRLEDSDSLLVDLLDGALNLVAVRVRGGMGDVGLEEAEVSCKGEADRLRIRAETGDKMTLGIVGGYEATDAFDYIIMLFGLRTENSHESTVVVDEGQSLGVTADGWRWE